MEAVSRRSFLKITSIAAGSSLVLGFNFLSEAQSGHLADAIFSPNAYITINSSGLVTLMAPNPEIGQGIKTALPMILAEELGVQWDKIEVDMAPLDPKFGSQTAGGSGAIRSRFTPIRQAGATARQMLITAAAQQWNVKEEDCHAEDGMVIHQPTGKKLTYGELAAPAAKLPVPTDVKLKDPKDFKIIGTRVANIDNHKIITGQPLYGIDTRRPGMLFAMVSRPPAFGKTLKSFDASASLKVAGVKNVVQAHGVVAVLATSTWAAKKGRDVLKVVWEDSSPLESTTEHETSFANLINTKSENPSRNDGDVDAAFNSGGKVIEAVYAVPNLSHAPMEPINFFADVKDGKAELYGPTQVPANMRQQVAKALNIAPENVSIGMPRQGGGFGRKLRPDNGVEAALISAAAKAPIQLMWTREDDIQGDYYRPASMSKYRAVISADNQLVAWHANAAVLSSGSALMGRGFPGASIPNFRLDGHTLQSNIPTGPWRGPTANASAFGDESFLDELALEMKKDPVALRLELLEKARTKPVGQVGYDIDKFKSVIDLVVQMSNWGKTTQKDVFHGFAAYYSFNTYVAQVVEVILLNGNVRVNKVYCAVNCGRVVNLSGAENQVEGAIVDGLSHALFSKITFEKGAAVQKNFNTYKFLHMKDAPLQVQVKFVQTEDAPTGLGEPGLPPIAPAVANAIFAATGKRYRKLPFELGTAPLIKTRTE
jgi:isoquinoline 1-oxidoreductase beta subunit